MENYLKNLKLLEKNHVYSKEMEHDACERNKSGQIYRENTEKAGLGNVESIRQT